MTKPNQPQYRFLEVGETVQAGDEWFDGTPCDAVIGESVLGYYKGRIRRPIPAPDDLARELADALGIIVETADRLHSELLCIGESVQDQKVYIELEQARAVLAKYKEQVKVYETVEGKAVKCA